MKKVRRPKDYDRPGKRGQTASTADLRAPRRPVDGMDLDYGIPMDSPSWQYDD